MPANAIIYILDFLLSKLGFIQSCYKMFILYVMSITCYEFVHVLDLKEKLDGEGELIHELMDSMDEIRKISETPTKVEIVRPRKGSHNLNSLSSKTISTRLNLN